jgi:predicted flap endonuclease-1-like 5' DNA nuclease
LTEVEGIGEVYAGKLRVAGVHTEEELLDRCTTPRSRKELAESAGLSEKLVLKWANRADLVRVKGIGAEYADLLEVAGVDTVPELAQRNPANLHAKMVEVNAAKSLVRQVPVVSQIEDWVSQAKELPRILSY